MHQMNPSQLQCKVLRQELLRTTGLPLSFLSPFKVSEPLLLFSTYFPDSDVPLSSAVGNLQGGLGEGLGMLRFQRRCRIRHTVSTDGGTGTEGR